MAYSPKKWPIPKISKRNLPLQIATFSHLSGITHSFIFQIENLKLFLENSHYNSILLLEKENSTSEIISPSCTALYLASLACVIEIV
jgi:hypothetical protein